MKNYKRLITMIVEINTENNYGSKLYYLEKLQS